MISIQHEKIEIHDNVFVVTNAYNVWCNNSKKLYYSSRSYSYKDVHSGNVVAGRVPCKVIKTINQK